MNLLQGWTVVYYSKNGPCQELRHMHTAPFIQWAPVMAGQPAASLDEPYRTVRFMLNCLICLARPRSYQTWRIRKKHRNDHLSPTPSKRKQPCAKSKIAFYTRVHFAPSFSAQGTKLVLQGISHSVYLNILLIYTNLYHIGFSGGLELARNYPQRCP